MRKAYAGSYLKNYAKTISEDEMITLSIHLKKISG